MSESYFSENPENDAYLQDAIDQADWLTNENDYATIDDLWQSNPELFDQLAQTWRNNHPHN